MQELLAQRRWLALSQAWEAEASCVGCFSSVTTAPPPGAESKHPRTKHGCNLMKSFRNSRRSGAAGPGPGETAEVTDLLQGGPQLRIVALQLAPVNFQLCHGLLQTFKPLCQLFLLLHSRTRLSLCYLQGRPRCSPGQSYGQ